MYVMKTTRTYTEAEGGLAEDFCRRMNRHAKGGDLIVIVEGPGDGELTVMPIKDAIENEFLYRWVA